MNTYFTETSEYVIVVISLIILFILLVLIVYSYYRNTPSTRIFLECPAGECPTNIVNGEKRCPADSFTKVLYDPVYEVCNSKYTCENRQTPYALLSDGSTNSMGICESESICRCVSQSRCSQDIVTMFKMVNGNINIPDSRSTFVQIPLESQGSNQNFTFKESNVDFCAIKAYHLDRISPGACTFNNEANIELNELITCFNKNPCQVGVLAFYPNDSSKFTLNNQNTNAIYNIPVACVPGIKEPVDGEIPLTNFCGKDSVPVWNKRTARINCKSVL